MIDISELAGAAGVEIALEDVGSEIVVALGVVAATAAAGSGCTTFIAAFLPRAVAIAHRLPTPTYYADMRI